MGGQRIIFCLVLLLLQLSCVFSRNNFYEYFYSRHHKRSTTPEIKPEISSSGSTSPEITPETSNSGTPALEMSSTTTDETCCSTEIMRSDYYDHRNEVMSGPFAWMIIILYISLGIGCCGICVLICRCCCCNTRAPKSLGFVISSNREPQEAPAVPRVQTQPFLHQPPEHQLPMDPPPYETQALPAPQYNPAYPQQQYSYQNHLGQFADVQGFMPKANAPAYEKY